ncbi:MAG: DNA polymerase Y family protein [Planctomycetota bacterium]|nr:DNA polymerase Y family protein [Planctomycetota bacterium]
MARAMSVWFPWLEIELSRRRRRCGCGVPSGAGLTLVVAERSGREVVIGACWAAGSQGITRGMALSAARGVVRGPCEILRHDAHAVGRFLRACGLWAMRFSPIVGLVCDDGLSLDIRGCAHLFGGEAAMVRRVRGGLAGLGLTARVAIAPTHAGARALARYGDEDGVIVGSRELAGALAPLPLAALGLERDVVEGLEEVNVRTVGELAGLSPAEVSARFGSEPLRSLDAITGRSREFIDALRDADPPGARVVFDGPSDSVEAIGLACRRALERMSVELGRRSAGTEELVVTLTRSDLEPLHLLVRLSAPSRDAAHLWRLLEPRLERAPLGFGVEGVAVESRRTRRMREAQQFLWKEERRGESDVSPMLDALVNRLGHEAVLWAQLVESHVPERAARFRSVLDRGSEGRGAEMRAWETRGGGGGEPEQRHPPGDRPTRLFETPRLVRVISLSPDGPVSRLEWEGAELEVRCCAGPERIRGAWWEGERLLRDYFRVQDGLGRWLWVFRDGVSGRWFVHGMWC